MKTIRLIGVLFFTFAVGSVFAQLAPEFIGVDAQHVYVQTGNNTAVPATYSAGVTGPYAFVVSVEGDNDLSDYLPIPSFTVPGGSTYAGPLTLALQTGNDWRRSNYYSSSPFAGDFPAGTYTVTANGHTLSLGLSGNLFPSAPAVNITGGSGTWSGSTLMVNPGTTLSLTTGSFAGFDESNGALFNHVGLFMNHNGTDVADFESFSDGAAPYFTSGTGNPDFLAITNYTFTSGTYFVEMEFNAVTGIDTSYTNVNSLALYTARTTFNIQVIPEPSTYAAMFGVVALAGVMMARRRRAA
ncbi:MAG: PEP-CTERM sorting domain-containing protein [Lacunisphaera sp.]|nr:PEP-CTERM sorting domain-containing protein [Lacunisphaera sp.]